MKNIDNKFMDDAINLALKSFQLNEVPVGCIIVDANNKIVGYGYNSSIKNHDPTSHAEIMAIRMACKKRLWWKNGRKTIIQAYPGKNKEAFGWGYPIW